MLKMNSKFHIKAVVLLVAIAPLSTNACKRWEYAKLKDATKQELTESYCLAGELNVINREMVEVHKKALAEFRTIGLTSNSQNVISTMEGLKSTHAEIVVCAGVMDDAGAMLRKKFKIENPKCSTSAKKKKAQADSIFVCVDDNGKKELSEKDKGGCRRLDVP